MANTLVLVADSDPRSLSAVEAALRKARLDVATASDGAAAEALLARGPSLVLCEVAPPGLDGYAIARAVRANPALANVPVLLTGVDRSKEARSLAVAAGADALLGKPLVLGELVARIQQLLGKKPARAVESAAFRGEVGELGLVDLFQSLEQWRKTAQVICEAPDGREACVWVHEGRILDAEAWPLSGEAAFYRLLTWTSGSFRVEFGKAEREARIATSIEGLVLEAMRRVDELHRAEAELPPSARYALDTVALGEVLHTLPDEANGVLRLFDGRRTLREVLEVSPLDDLATLELVRGLLAKHVLHPEAQVPRGKPPPPPDDASLESTPPPVDEAVVQENEAGLRLVRYPPLRGVRKERLRREAEAAKARAEAGLPPPAPAAAAPADPGAAPRREISPAVGEAARRFAPDVPVARLPAPSTPPPVRSSRGRTPLLVAAFVLLLLCSALAVRLFGASGGPAQVSVSTIARPPDAFDEAMARAGERAQRGAFREAAADYRKALLLRAESIPARLGLGEALLQSGEAGAAMLALREAVKRAPGDARAHLLLGEACQAAGRIPEASAAWAKVIALDAEGPLAVQARSHLARLSR